MSKNDQNFKKAKKNRQKYRKMSKMSKNDQTFKKREKNGKKYLKTVKNVKKAG